MVLERLIVVFSETLIALIPNRPLRLLVGGVVLVCVLALLILLVRLVFRWLDRRLTSWKGRVFRPVRWQAQELLSEQDVSNAIRGVGRVARNLVYVLVSLAVLRLVFVLMPETSALGRTLLGYFIDAVAGVFNAFVGFLPSLATLIVLYFLAAYTVKFAGVVFRGIENGRIRIVGFEQEWSPITYKIIRGSVWVLFVVVAFPYFPLSGSPAFQGLSIFFGVLFSLGGSQMVSNVIAGVMLTYMNAFKVGDRIKIADAEGVIVAKTTHVTRRRTSRSPSRTRSS